MTGVQRCTPISGERPAKNFLRSIHYVFTVKEMKDSPQQQRWTTSNHTVEIESSSGTKRIGNPSVKAVTPRRLLKKMEDSAMLLNPQRGRGSESLQKC